MSQNNFENTLNELGKKEVKKKGYTIDDIVNEKEEEIDFAAIANELEKELPDEPGANDDHIKTTLYLDKNIWKAFDSLTKKRGAKKEAANAAIALWVVQEFNRRKSES